MGTEFLFLVLLFLPAIENINLKLEGLIDLGPNWNFEYSLIPLRENQETEATGSVVPIKIHVTEPTSPPTTKTSRTKTTSNHPYYEDPSKRKKKKRKHRKHESNTQMDVVKATIKNEYDAPVIGKTSFETDVKPIRLVHKDGPRERITKIDTYDSYTKRIKTKKSSKSKRNRKHKKSKHHLAKQPTTTQANDLTSPNNPDQKDTDTNTTKKEEKSETVKSEKVKKKSKRNRKHKSSNNEQAKQPTTQANDFKTNTTKKEENTAPGKSKKVTEKPSTTTTTQAYHLRQTQHFVAELNTSHKYDEIHKVKEDTRITDFTIHILRQSLQVFDTIKNKVDDEETKKKIDSLSRNYQEKFTDFVLDTRNQNVKTRIGTKKVVLNTIGTSQRIMNRLINYLTGDIIKKGLRYDGIENVIHSEVKKELEMEYQHACAKFGICRSSDGFQKFLMDIITEIIKNDDQKLKYMNDVLTDVVKNTDFSNIVDPQTQKNFYKGIEGFETMDTKVIRPTYTMYRNAIGLRNKPIAVMEGFDAQMINKSVAFLDLMDTLDANIKPTEANVEKWNKIKHNLSLWTSEKTKDIQSTIEVLINHIADEASTFDAATIDSLNTQLKTMLRTGRHYKYDYF